MTTTASPYIPALSFRWLTPLYDPLLKWGMREALFKRRLIQRAQVRPGESVLDLGCGTGTLTLMLKQAVPAARVMGLDGDPKTLSIARRKSARLRLPIQWDLGMAYDLPYPDGSFDVVLSSLVIHHLASQDKLRTFCEALRVLRPGGRLQIADFGRPIDALTRLQAMIMGNLEHAGDNVGGRIVPMLLQAGFSSATEAAPVRTIFGPIWFFSGLR